MDSGNYAWAITAIALVVLMTPGVAFFYGGLVRAKSVISMLMMSFGALALVSVLWILYGYNMSLGGDEGGFAFAGSPVTEHVALAGMDSESLIGVAYGATFAIITTALISGAIADRAKFGAWMIFAGVWATVVYFPVAAWVWGDGWIFNWGATTGLPDVIDYAGGTAVHINAGAAALALALVLGRRRGFAKGAHKPHNVPLTLLGAAILWFGWFGFNTGAEGVGGLLGPDNTDAGEIVINTLGATAAAILGWLIVEKVKDGKPTSVGAASGAVAGLVAITPACAALDPGWALLLGAAAGALCALAVELKYKLGYDDSLDVVGIHMVGGFLGCWFLGFFAQDTGLFTGGDAGQLVSQVVASLVVAVFSFVVAFLIGSVIDKTIGFRVRNEDELAGVDLAVHGESGYAMVD